MKTAIILCLLLARHVAPFQPARPTFDAHYHRSPLGQKEVTTKRNVLRVPHQEDPFITDNQKAGGPRIKRQRNTGHRDKAKSVTTTIRRRNNMKSNRPRQTYQRRRQKRSRKGEGIDDKWDQAELVESRLISVIDILRATPSAAGLLPSSFPSIRQCNAALAAFGDGGDFLRALGLFLKMRKATSLAQRTREWKQFAPAPTLVTYCTLMSRAVQAGKPRLALRLWHLMKTQPEFFSSHSLPSPPTSSKTKRETSFMIVPDVKAANILMNVYAKLADVESATILMDQMVYGNGTDVPKLTPNLVTFNSWIDACHRGGDLDTALEAKRRLDRPDATTFTTLIATVGRRASKTSGAFDPTVAFHLLHEMRTVHKIRPNGRTYSALIDVCGRCKRPDLALKGLRIMFRQKAEENGMALVNEVGAWTSAINALGKVGHLESAMKLFYTMPKFGVKPNTVTCGCMMDCLFRHGKTADALNVLKYMKHEGIQPCEVMYTSLMTSAEGLVRGEKTSDKKKHEDAPLLKKTTAIELYSALMKSLLERHDDQGLLLKVFLVFQEMRSVGAQPDVACYNALFRACARAGDLTRALEVLDRMLRVDNLTPNDTSWKQLLQAACTAKQGQIAEQLWNKALETNNGWTPGVDAFAILVDAYMREAASTKKSNDQKRLFKRIVTMYRDIMAGSEKRKINKEDLKPRQRKDQQALQTILRAIVSLQTMEVSTKHKKVWRKLAVSVFKLMGWDKRHNQQEAQSRTKLFDVVHEWFIQSEKQTS